MLIVLLANTSPLGEAKSCSQAVLLVCMLGGHHFELSHCGCSDVDDAGICTLQNRENQKECIVLNLRRCHTHLVNRPYALKAVAGNLTCSNGCTWD